jgi:hypothetical protein
MRPTCGNDMKKLGRRLNKFLEESFCDDAIFCSGWCVTVVNQKNYEYHFVIAYLIYCVHNLSYKIH